MTVGVILALVATGLALLLARETKLRRALQALCSQLLARLSETTGGAVGRRGPPHRRPQHERR